MMLFLASFAVMALAGVGLGVGVLLGGAPLERGCGGDPVLQVCPICRTRKSQ